MHVNKKSDDDDDHDDDLHIAVGGICGGILAVSGLLHSMSLPECNTFRITFLKMQQPWH